jgi:hypothetical protein
MTQMRIVLDDASATSLYRWLAQDRELGRVITFSLGEGKPGEMGGALDVINVVLANSIALASLITAIASWRTSRRSPARVLVERGDVRITVEGDSPGEIERLVQALSEAP